MQSILKSIFKSILALALTLICSAGFAQESFDYLKTIKPILSNKCYTCHGPDEATRQGGFRFDINESAFGEADSGNHPIVPGNSSASEILKRIHADGDSRMPPADQERQLTPAERTLLKEWIDAGAPWQEHWSFIRPKAIAVPDVESTESWRQNPIDGFIAKRLVENGISPSSQTDRPTLIRRVTLDLTGLPPEPEELRAFLADKSDNAYEKLVDRLLTSQHYGEQMASVWLDAARFADTNGYQNDFSRKMWLWRDWVINAYNMNMPFDQFTIEQIAGDMLPDSTLEQKIASGFNRNNRSVTEGGSIEEEWHVENVIDRVETTSTVFLGLTVGCARCHDHKFDPISQREFYEFYAYFNSSKDKGVYNEKRGNFGPMVSVASDSDRERLQQLEDRIAQNEMKLNDLESTLPQRQTDWESKFKTKQFGKVRDHVGGLLTGGEVRPESLSNHVEQLGVNFPSMAAPFKSEFGIAEAVLIEDKENAHVDLGKHFEFDGSKPFSVSVWVKPLKYGAILSRMDAAGGYRGFDMVIMENGKMDVHLIHHWDDNGIKITVKTPLARDRWSHVALTYDGSNKAAGFKIFYNNAPIEFDVRNDNLSKSTLTDHPFWLGKREHTPRLVGKIADVRVYDRVLNLDGLDSLASTSIVNSTQIPLAERTEEQKQFLTHQFQDRFSTQESNLSKTLAAAKQELKQYRDRLPTTMVMEEMKQPRKTYRLNRGQYDQPDKSVELQPGIPKFLPQPDESLPGNRLGLARWLVSSENPLTARVTVNRFWQHYFGVGLVETSENFGVQSPLPSHPQLLDWLATEFIRSGWDVKHLQKLIVTSATYRQSSRVDQERLTLDPENRWYGRGPRFRLPAEAIRDNALAIGGLLNRRIGGRSIKPYQPDGIWKELAGGAGEAPYKQEIDDNLYRRSMYIYRKRTVPHPTMSTFDAGGREICQVARQRTNTPLQALALLNDATYVEAARALALRCIEHHEKLDEQIAEAFIRSTSRSPTIDELQILRRAFQRYQKQFAKDPKAADEFLKVGVMAFPEKVNKPGLAAMTAVCSTIMNLDETITKE